MKYYVYYKIEARYLTEIEADNLTEALRKAEEEYYDADFGVAEDIEGEPIVVADESGDVVWEQ